MPKASKKTSKTLTTKKNTKPRNNGNSDTDDVMDVVKFGMKAAVGVAVIGALGGAMRKM